MKPAYTFIMVILAAGLAEARPVYINGTSAANGTIMQDGFSYRILFSWQSEAGTAYIVENLSRIDELAGQERSAAGENEQLSTHLKALDNLSNEVARLKAENEDALRTLEKQTVYYKQVVSSLDGEKHELEQEQLALQNQSAGLEQKRALQENKLTSNVVLPPATYRFGVISLIILVAVAVILQGRHFMITREEKQARHKGELSS